MRSYLRKQTKKILFSNSSDASKNTLNRIASHRSFNFYHTTSNHYGLVNSLAGRLRTTDSRFRFSSSRSTIQLTSFQVQRRRGGGAHADSSWKWRNNWPIWTPYRQSRCPCRTCNLAIETKPNQIAIIESFQSTFNRTTMKPKLFNIYVRRFRIKNDN